MERLQSCNLKNFCYIEEIGKIEWLNMKKVYQRNGIPQGTVSKAINKAVENRHKAELPNLYAMWHADVPQMS